MHKYGITVNNGVDIDVAWTDRIAIAKTPMATAPAGAGAAAAAGGSLPDDTYYYIIRALGYNGESPASSEVNATTAGANNTVNVTWTAQNYVAEYHVYRGLATGDYNGYWRVFTNSFSDTGAIAFSGYMPSVLTAAAYAGGSLADDTYYYAVSVVGLDGEETYISAEANATTAGANNSVQLHWAACSYASEYRVYRGTATGVYDGYVVATNNHFIDTGLLTPLSNDIKASSAVTSIQYETILTSSIKNVYALFSPQVKKHGDIIQPRRSYVVIEMEDDKRMMINCEEVKNQATWSAGTEAATQIAADDINSWIA